MVLCQRRLQPARTALSTTEHGRFGKMSQPGVPQHPSALCRSSLVKRSAGSNCSTLEPPRRTWANWPGTEPPAGEASGKGNYEMWLTELHEIQASSYQKPPLRKREKGGEQAASLSLWRKEGGMEGYKTWKETCQ